MLMRFFALLFAWMFLVSAAFAVPAPKDWGDNEWYQYIEATVTLGLGEATGAVLEAAGQKVVTVPVLDVYSALSGAGAATKPALSKWLEKKMADAQNADDLDRLERYQAYHTALMTGDDARLKSYLKKAYAKAQGGSGSIGGDESVGIDHASTPTTFVNLGRQHEAIGVWQDSGGLKMRIYPGDGGEYIGTIESIPKTSKYAAVQGDFMFTDARAPSKTELRSNHGYTRADKADKLKEYPDSPLTITVSGDSLSLTQKCPGYNSSGWHPELKMTTQTVTYKRVGD